jgi:hypothetical protein
MEMLKVALFNGSEPNKTVNVTDTGSLQADVSGSTVDASGSAVDSTIAPSVADVETVQEMAGTTSAEMAAADATRSQIVLQNLDGANSIHINLGEDAATTDDLRIPPGGSFSFPVGMAYQGAIQAIATDVDTKYVLVIFRTT